MKTKKTIIASSLTIALLILSAAGIPAFDRSALAAVTLASFTATGGDGQVLIEWETASEINNIGFDLWRSTSETGDYARLNDSLIPSQAMGSVIGAHYYYTDSDVSNGAIYYYKLESVATDGSSEFHGPISATPGAQPTATPTATPTSVWTSTPPATATATATPTPTPYAGTILNVRMSDTPEGAEVTQFPSGTSVVYVVFDYSDMHGEEFRVRVYDYVGNVLFDQVKVLTGSGTESIAVTHPEGRAFPGGRYVTNLYSGVSWIKTIIWEVTATLHRVYLPVMLKNYSAPTPCLDEYEPDDTWQQARLIEVNQVIQSRNFHTTDDRDYVRFVAEADSIYTIRTLNLSAGNDTVLTLHDTDGTTQLEYNDDDPYNPPASKIVWLCPTTGTYFVKAAPFGTRIGGCDKTYDLKITSAPPPTSTPTVTNTPFPTPTATPTPSSTPGFELPDNLPAVEAIYPLSDVAKGRLRASGLVALPDQDVERLSNAYMRLFSEEQVSVFITTDVALHLFHNVFDDLLAEVEKAHLYDDVEWLVQQLYAASTARYAAIPETQTLCKAAARHDVLVFAVAARLLDDSFVPPDYIEPDASQYVQKVLDHTLIEFYPGDDYTQYEPRGHYAGDEQLERYFRAVKWLSRRIFRIEDTYYPDDADVELTAAALLAQLTTDDPAVEARWNKVYDVTRLLAGPADSITPPMVQQALDNVFGASFTLDMLQDAANRDALRAELQRDIYPTSEIIPVPTEFVGQIPPKYVQFLGERYLPDGEAMQETCFPYVADRWLPSGLDVMATVLASDRAEHWLMDDIAAYPELTTQLTVLRAQFDAYTVADWTKSTYNGWLYSLRPLLRPMPAGAPAFMQGTAWQDKELNTALGSWTQLRHDFILYGKQTYIPSPWAEGPGLVEPVPATFDRLADLCDQVHSTLNGYDMLPEIHGRRLRDLATKLRTWRDYARKVAEGGWLSEEEQGDIHRVGLWLLDFFSEGWGVEEKSPLLVADVASDSNTGRVLHEGTGHFNPLIIVYTPPGGEPMAGIGYIFSHYEFAEPDWNRLNDAEWASRLEENPPPRPAWASGFLPLDRLGTKHSSAKYDLFVQG